MRIQADFEARPMLGGAGTRHTSLQVVIELLRDQPFFEQRLIPSHLLPKRRLSKKSDLESGHIVGVLTTKRVQGITHFFAAVRDDFAGDPGKALLEHRA